MDMIPDKYIFDKADSLSNFLDRSRFNGLLLDGLLAYINNHPDRTLTLDPLGFFNTAYFFANRVMFELFPEIDIRNHYIGECMDRTQDVVTRDIVIAMLYVILDRISNPPGKVIRFCNQLEVIYNYREGYLGDITQISDDCDNAGVSSDWYWTPPAVAGYSVIGMDVNWREATEDFKYDNVKAYSDASYDEEDRFFVMKDILAALDEFVKNNPDSLTERQIGGVRFLHSTAKFAYDKTVKKAEDEKKRKEEEEKKAAEAAADLPSPEVVEYENKLAEKDKVIKALNDRIIELGLQIDEKDRDLESQAGDIVFLNQALEDQKKQILDEAQEDPLDEPDKRTQRIVTLYLYEILKKAGMGTKESPFNITDVAELIHYLTGFSFNTVRTSLHSGTVPSKSKKEVREVAKILKKLNLSVSIE